MLNIFCVILRRCLEVHLDHKKGELVKAGWWKILEEYGMVSQPYKKVIWGLEKYLLVGDWWVH